VRAASRWYVGQSAVAPVAGGALVVEVATVVVVARDDVDVDVLLDDEHAASTMAVTRIATAVRRVRVGKAHTVPV
jgi:hypothetical protein